MAHTATPSASGFLHRRRPLRCPLLLQALPRRLRRRSQTTPCVGSARVGGVEFAADIQCGLTSKFACQQPFRIAIPSQPTLKTASTRPGSLATFNGEAASTRLLRRHHRLRLLRLPLRPRHRPRRPRRFQPRSTSAVIPMSGEAQSVANRPTGRVGRLARAPRSQRALPRVATLVTTATTNPNSLAEFANIPAHRRLPPRPRLRHLRLRLRTPCRLRLGPLEARTRGSPAFKQASLRSTSVR
jgi:hypothetical protein